MMSHTAALQHALHDLLTSYINGGCVTHADRAWSLLSSRLPFERNAKRVSGAHEAFREETSHASLPQEVVTVEAYDGNNPFVQRMMDYLANSFQDELVGAYVHGSLATQEEIAYSDFDALVILRDYVFEDSRRLVDVAVRLSRARRIMFDADPLQHHGWFVLTEADMRYYCDAYFPRVLFAYSKSLLQNQGHTLLLKPRNSFDEIREGFDRLAASCLKMTANRHCLNNAYLVKCALSQFMLLPALYVHVRDGQGVYKKFSFGKARRDFSAAEWECMDRISQLRTAWHLPFGPLTRVVLSGSGALRSAAVKRIAPAIPEHIRVIFTPAFIAQMASLICRMQEALSVR
jgi:predicted nucleotidyltransferase